MPADDDHWMRPHDVNDGVTPKFVKAVGADDGVVMAAPNVVHSRFELDDIVNVGSICNRPVHPATNAAERESPVRVTASHPLERRQHPVLIEVAIPEIFFRIEPNLELSAPLASCGVDPECCQSLQMVMPLIRIYDMNRFVARLEPVLDERKQDPILLVVAIEKRTDVTYLVELRACKMNGSHEPVPSRGVWIVTRESVRKFASSLAGQHSSDL